LAQKRSASPTLEPLGPSLNTMFVMPSAPSSRQQISLPALPSAWKGQFEIVQEMPVIGSGAFGTIFQVRDRGSHGTFAVKVMQRHHYDIRGMSQQLSKEVQTMQRAASIGDPGWSRIVQFHGVQEEAGFVFLLLELCVYGSLTQQMAHHPQGLSEATALRCTRHLLQGLRDIHRAGIIHRDIKLENLLITTNGVLKITDFGWAVEAREKPSGLAGTFDTMAPEVLQQQPQSVAVDMWSAGAVLFHMVCGRRLLSTNVGAGATQLTVIDPHRADSERRRQLLQEIRLICPLSYRTRPKHVSEACWDLIRRLLEPEVSLRLTAEDALKHGWLHGQKVVGHHPSMFRSRMGGA